MHERGRSPGAKKAIRRAGGASLRLLRLGSLAVVSTLAGACATAPTKGVDVDQQEHVLIALRAQNATYVRQIEELQNRIFILEDRLDSRRVAAERRAAPELPPPAVVTLSRRSHVLSASPVAASSAVATATLAGSPSAGQPVPTQARDNLSTVGVGSLAPRGAPLEVGSAPVEDEERPLTRGERRAAARDARKLAIQQRLEEKRALAVAAREARARKEGKAAEDHEGAVASRSSAQAEGNAQAAQGEPGHSGQASGLASAPASPTPANMIVSHSSPAPAAPVKATKRGPHPADAAGPAALPEQDPDEVEIPEGPYLSIETPVDYVGEAALGPHLVEDGRAGRQDQAVRPKISAAAPVRAKPAAQVRPRPLDLYKEALEALHAGHHPAALVGFRRFLALHPHHDYADNAQYWIGECFYDQGSYPGAIQEFRRVVELYPRGNKVPDAMLKLGFSLAASGDEQGARRVLSSLVKAYPDNQSARLAFEKLDGAGLARANSVSGRLKAEATFGASVSALVPAREDVHR